MKNSMMVVCAALLLGLTAGCSSSKSSSSTISGGSSQDSGRSTDVLLPSELDGEIIAFTVHEPDGLESGSSYPLILHSHGYGGTRQSSRPTSGLLARFLANGYGVLSLDERGHGQSGGTIRILDPNREGQDWLQVLDWTQANLDWLAADGSGNPLIGAVGGSYGGGYQHLIYALDPEHRLDALAPDITWHDLRYSLNSGNVFKSTWATLLSGFGNSGNNRQDAEVNEGLAQGLGTNSLDAEKLALLYQNSLRSHCEGNNAATAPGGLTPIDVLYTQSHLDTLFNFNDAHHNFQCLAALGGDVRLFTKSTGHGLDNGDGGDNCNGLERADATFLWFEEKLKGQAGAAAQIARVCLNLSATGSDGIALDEVAVGGAPVTIAQQTLTVSAANVDPVIVSLYTAPAGGDVLAGIPTIELAITDPVTGGENPVLDPIVFIGIGVQRSGGSAPSAPLMNQIRPFRGYGPFDSTTTYDNELIGVMERLAEGDQVVLMLFPSYATQYSSSATRTAATINLDATIGLPLLGIDPG